MLGVTPKDLIIWAYGLKAYQVSGPSWITQEWYDINAKAAEPVPEDRLRLMVRSLLSQRFKMGAHTETRTLPVYLLTVARNGPKIHPVTSEGPAGYIPRQRGLAARHITMPRFAELLSGKIDRPVTDMTGLPGLYDIDLDWAPDTIVPPDADLGPSVFTAIQEQLGLKLEPTKGPLEILVIDHIERPSEN
jgi:uncharacterized protein (TIGR03435 family)